ncbi:hypothetical protein BASA81_011278 [Batrachochytrium salamandrivorans]|nr:hypothetical protein BASA81_011278 [Batrachochytrium salamandrivorans]
MSQAGESELDLDIIPGKPYPCGSGVLCLDRGSVLLTPTPLLEPEQKRWKNKLVSNGQVVAVARTAGDGGGVYLFKLEQVEQQCQEVEQAMLDKTKMPADRRELISRGKPYHVVASGLDVNEVFINQQGDVATLSNSYLGWFPQLNDYEQMATVSQIELVALSSSKWLAYYSLGEVHVLSTKDFTRVAALPVSVITSLAFCLEDESKLCLATSEGELVMYCDFVRVSSLEVDKGITSVLWPELQVLAYTTPERFKVVELSLDLTAMTKGRFAVDPLAAFPESNVVDLEWYIDYHSIWRCFFLSCSWTDNVCAIGFDDYGDGSTDWVQWYLKRGMESDLQQVQVLDSGWFQVSDRHPLLPLKPNVRVLGMCAVMGSKSVSPFLVLRNNEEVEGKADYPAPVPSLLVLNSEGLLQLVGLVDCTPTGQMEEKGEDGFVVVEETEDEEEYVEVDPPGKAQPFAFSAPPPPFPIKKEPPPFAVKTEPFGLFTSSTLAVPVTTPAFSFSSAVPAFPFSSAVPATTPAFSSAVPATTPAFSSSAPTFPGFGAAITPASSSTFPPPPATTASFLFSPATTTVTSASKIETKDVSKTKSSHKESTIVKTVSMAKTGEEELMNNLTRDLEQLKVKTQQLELENAKLREFAAAVGEVPLRVGGRASELSDPVRPKFLIKPTTRPSLAPVTTTSSGVPQTNLVSVYKELERTFMGRSKELESCFDHLSLDPFPPCFDHEGYEHYTKHVFSNLEQTFQSLSEVERLASQVGFTCDAANAMLQGKRMTSTGTRGGLLDQDLLNDLTQSRNVLEYQCSRLQRELALLTCGPTRLTLEQDYEYVQQRIHLLLDIVDKFSEDKFTKQSPILQHNQQEEEEEHRLVVVAKRFPTVTRITPLVPAVKGDVFVNMTERFRETVQNVEQTQKEWTMHIAQVEELQLKYKKFDKVNPPPPPPALLVPVSAMRGLDSAVFAKPPEFKPKAIVVKEEEPVAPVMTTAPVVDAVLPTVADFQAQLSIFYTEIGQPKTDVVLAASVQKYQGKLQEMTNKLREKYQTEFSSKPHAKAAWERLLEVANSLQQQPPVTQTTSLPTTTTTTTTTTPFSFQQLGVVASSPTTTTTTGGFGSQPNNPFQQPVGGASGFGQATSPPSSAFGGFGQATSPPAFGGFAQPAAATTTAATGPIPNMQQSLIQFYQQFNPQKLGDVPGLLTRYAGKEIDMWLALKKKYPISSQFVDQILNALQQQQQQPVQGGGGFGNMAQPSPFGSGSGGFASFAQPNPFGGGTGTTGGGFGAVQPIPFGGGAPTTPAGGGGFGAVAQSTTGGGGGFGGFGQSSNTFDGGVNKNLSNAFSQMRG